MSNYEIPDVIVNIWGWILTIPVILSLLITWYFTLPEMLGQLKETITNCFISNSGEGFKKELANVEKKSKKTKTEQPKDADKEKRGNRVL